MLAVVIACWSGSGLLRAQRPDLAAKSQRAKEAMIAGRFDEAIALYTELSRALPNERGFVLDLGLALHSAGRYREAIPKLEAVVRAEPNRAPVWLLLGVDYLHVQQPERARQALERVLRFEPDNQTAHLELAEALMDLHRPQDAIAHYERMTKLDPENPRAWQGMGLGYVALSQATYAALEEVAPGSVYDKVLLARSLVNRNQFHMAFKLYSEALSSDPELRGAYEGIADIYRKTGHVDWAAVEESKEARLRPVDCQKKALECSFRAGQYQEIVASTRKAPSAEGRYWRALAFEQLAQGAFDHIAQLPPSTAAHSLMAEAYRILGRYDLAIDEWRKAESLAPQDLHVQEGLAKALWLNRQYDDALPWLEKLIVRDPESADLNFELGDCFLYSGGMASKAVPYLVKAVKLDASNLAARVALGRAYMRLNQPREAILYFKTSLEFDPDGTIYYQLAQAYEKAGQKELAGQTMHKFQEISKAAKARKPQNLEELQITPP